MRLLFFLGFYIDTVFRFYIDTDQVPAPPNPTIKFISSVIAYRYVTDIGACGVFFALFGVEFIRRSEMVFK